jgi:hypothetical protein
MLQSDYISRRHEAGRNDARIESAQTPTRRRRITLLHTCVVDLPFERFPVHIQRRAGTARLGDLDHRGARAQAIANPQIPRGDSASGEILAHGAVEEWIAAALQFIDGFGGQEENRLQGSAVQVGVRVEVPLNTKFGNHAGSDGAFGESSGGNIHLKDCSLHDFIVPHGLGSFFPCGSRVQGGGLRASYCRPSGYQRKGIWQTACTRVPEE